MHQKIGERTWFVINSEIGQIVIAEEEVPSVLRTLIATLESTLLAKEELYVLVNLITIW